MTSIKDFYIREYGGEEFTTESFLLRRIATIDREIAKIDDEIARRKVILAQMKENHEKHFVFVERLRQDAILKNSNGELHKLEHEKIMSELLRERRHYDLGEWQDTQKLHEERRKLVERKENLIQKLYILGGDMDYAGYLEKS
jgi:hypothetical protein